MQLSASSGKNYLIARAYFLAFGDSADHSTDWPLADVVVSLNRWYHRAATWIWKASRTWEFDDTNASDLPIATTTLVAAQQDYSIPTTANNIERVEVLDSNGDYVLLRQIDKTEIGSSMTEFFSTNGLPQYYDIIGRSIFLYPAPAAANVTTTAGLKIHVSRNVTEFSTPATYTTVDATEPGFEEQFHDILTYGAAYDWSVTAGLPQATSYRSEIELLHREISDFYGGRNTDKKVRVVPRRENYR